MKTSEILRSARALIEKPESWTRETFARDEDGHGVPALHYSATCFCALGAIRSVTGLDTDDTDAARALEAVIEFNDKYHEAHFCDVAEFNDDEDVTSHADVLELFDTAITEAEKEESANA